MKINCCDYFAFAIERFEDYYLLEHLVTPLKEIPFILKVGRSKIKLFVRVTLCLVNFTKNAFYLGNVAQGCRSNYPPIFCVQV